MEDIVAPTVEHATVPPEEVVETEWIASRERVQQRTAEQMVDVQHL